MKRFTALQFGLFLSVQIMGLASMVSAAVLVDPMPAGPYGTVMRGAFLPPPGGQIFSVPKKLQAANIQELREIFDILLVRDESNNMCLLLDNSLLLIEHNPSILRNFFKKALASGHTACVKALIDWCDMHGAPLNVDEYIQEAFTNVDDGVLECILNYVTTMLEEDAGLREVFDARYIDELFKCAATKATGPNMQHLLAWADANKFGQNTKKYIIRSLENRTPAVLDALIRHACIGQSSEAQAKLYNDVFIAAVQQGCSYAQVSVLLDGPVDEKCRDRHGMNALHYTVLNCLNAINPDERAKFLGLFNCLCTEGCDPVAVDNKGNTPLHVALLSKVRVHTEYAWAPQTEELVRLELINSMLTMYYADVLAVNTAGKSPLDLALKYRFDLIKERLAKEIHEDDALIGKLKPQIIFGAH